MIDRYKKVRKSCLGAEAPNEIHRYPPRSKIACIGSTGFDCLFFFACLYGDYGDPSCTSVNMNPPSPILLGYVGNMRSLRLFCFKTPDPTSPSSLKSRSRHFYSKSATFATSINRIRNDHPPHLLLSLSVSVPVSASPL